MAEEEESDSVCTNASSGEDNPRDISYLEEELVEKSQDPDTKSLEAKAKGDVSSHEDDADLGGSGTHETDSSGEPEPEQVLENGKPEPLTENAYPCDEGKDKSEEDKEFHVSRSATHDVASPVVVFKQSPQTSSSSPSPASSSASNATLDSSSKRDSLPLSVDSGNLVEDVSGSVEANTLEGGYQEEVSENPVDNGEHDVTNDAPYILRKRLNSGKE